MDLKSSNAVKQLYKASARLSLLYFVLFAGIGGPILYYSVIKCLTEFATNFLISAIMSLGFVIAAGFFLKLLITKDYGSHIQEYFAEHPETTIAELDQDFAEAEHIKNLWIGTKCTFHMGYLYPYIVENKDLIWIYLTHISGKSGGWRVNFCDKNKKMTCFTLKSKKKFITINSNI
jgi:hypothetical protein